MWNMRTKLALSHILPVLIVLPVLSLYFLYGIEKLFTQNLLQQLTFQALLLRDESERDPQLMVNPQATQSFIARIAGFTDARVILLSNNATILGSTRSEDSGRIGQQYIDSAVAQALSGEGTQGVGPGLTTDVAYVVLPLQYQSVTGGVLRISYEVNDLSAKFDRMRWVILGGTGLSIIFGLAFGLGLATIIVRPLSQLNKNVARIAAGDYRARVKVQSGDEVGSLVQSFNRMADRLEEAERARERLLASITHELMRPLTVMRAAVETLRDSLENEEMRETLLTNLEEEFTRFGRLIGTLQGLHKHTLRPIQLNCTEVSLARVLRASAVSFEPLAVQRGIELTVNVADDLPNIRADEDRLIQVVTNLLDNAFKFTPARGAITIQASADKDNEWVQVRDTGVGIAPNELPHVFEEFYSGDESRPPEKRGMGLGLAISREIITAHRGQIRIESEIGRGTSMTFSLPLH